MRWTWGDAPIELRTIKSDQSSFIDHRLILTLMTIFNYITTQAILYTPNKIESVLDNRERHLLNKFPDSYIVS